jgi:3-mercaptopyruvate sulfurtransferase SseA
MQGATFWDWTQDGLALSTTVPIQLDLDKDQFAAIAEEKGIDSSRPVVVYDSGTAGSMFACRCSFPHNSYVHYVAAHSGAERVRCTEIAVHAGCGGH